MQLSDTLITCPHTSLLAKRIYFTPFSALLTPRSDVFVKVSDSHLPQRYPRTSCSTADCSRVLSWSPVVGNGCFRFAWDPLCQTRLGRNCTRSPQSLAGKRLRVNGNPSALFVNCPRILLSVAVSVFTVVDYVVTNCVV